MSNIDNIEKKPKSKKAIVIIIIAVVLVAAIAVLIVAFSKGWIGKKGTGEEEKYSVSYKYVDNGEAVAREDYYDDNGELVYKIVKGYSDENNTKLMQETYLNADDKITKVINYDEAGTKTGVDEYNDKAQLAIHYEYLEGKATGKYFTYEYTDSGAILASTTYSKDKKIINKVSREYDDKGNLTLYLETDGEGKQLSKTIYTYDSNGKEIKTTFYDADGVTGYVEYEYNDKGQKTRMNEYVDGKLSSYRTYTYDKDGAVTEKFHEVD